MRGDRTRDLMKALSATAAYYGQVLKDEVLLMYAEDLLTVMKLNFEDVIMALQEARLDQTNTRLPLPAQIRNRIHPQKSDDDKAREITASIMFAIKKFGPYQERDARSHMGEIGWKIVEGSGGWLTLNSMTEDQFNTARAQWTGLAKAYLKDKNAEEFRERLEITRNPKITELTQGLKQIPGAKHE